MAASSQEATAAFGKAGFEQIQHRVPVLEWNISYVWTLVNMCKSVGLNPLTQLNLKRIKKNTDDTLFPMDCITTYFKVQAQNLRNSMQLMFPFYYFYKF